mgnify:CR=1 FL=1
MFWYRVANFLYHIKFKYISYFHRSSISCYINITRFYTSNRNMTTISSRYNRIKRKN